MAGRDTDGPSGPEPRQEQLLARREAQRRARSRARRRRLIALGAAAVAIAAVVGVTVLTGGDSEDRSPGSSSPTAANATTGTGGEGRRCGHQGEATGRVRNATPQPDWEPHTGPVPILEYHVLGAAVRRRPLP